MHLDSVVQVVCSGASVLVAIIALWLAQTDRDHGLKIAMIERMARMEVKIENLEKVIIGDRRV